MTVKIFLIYDEDGSGYLDDKELESFLNDFMKEMGMNLKIEKKDLEEMLKVIDEDGNGLIDIDELLYLMKLLSKKFGFLIIEVHFFYIYLYTNIFIYK